MREYEFHTSTPTESEKPQCFCGVTNLVFKLRKHQAYVPIDNKTKMSMPLLTGLVRSLDGDN